MEGLVKICKAGSDNSQLKIESDQKFVINSTGDHTTAHYVCCHKIYSTVFAGF
jgi:hypothetical protein